MKNLIDTHAHLSFEQYDEDREKVIEECKKKLKAVITSGTKFDTNEDSIKLAKKYKNFIYSTMGLHPSYVKEMSQADVDKIKNQIRKNKDKIVGIGEIGLDYFHTKDVETRLKQKDIFKQLLDLAEELDLPVVLHTRDADKHALRILESRNVRGTMHCFNGNIELLNKAQRIGFFISVSTQVAYSKRVQEIAKYVDVNRILLETDSPYLGGGEKNYPWNIHNSLYKIAEIKEIQPEKLADIIFNNTKKIFPVIR